MKKLILSLLFIAGITVMATAQNVRVNAYAGYVFDDNIDYYGNTTNYFNGTVKGGFQYGVGVEYMTQPTVGVEVKWLHQDATAPMKYYNDGAENYKYDLGINYYLLDGNYYFHTGNTKIEPFLGFGLGVAVIGVKNPLNGVSQTNKTAFAWDLKGGTNIWVSDKVGIKLQASLLDASKAAGGYYYFGGVVGVSSYSYVNMLQFGLGGGLTFRLGK
jgi:hypothetical protein